MGESSGPAVNRIIPHNLTAKAAYNVIGNPPGTRPESGVANCFPGLEYDHRNLDRRFFPGLLVDYLSEGPQLGIRVVSVVADDSASQDPPGDDTALADALSRGLSQLSDRTTEAWFIVSVEQSATRITLIDDDGNPLEGLVCWRLIRSLRPGPVTLHLGTRPTATGDGAVPARQTFELRGWRRHYTDPDTGVIDSVYRPGELTQSLCSPWTHDFRDCSCTYWASNHPDIVAPAIPLRELTQPGGAPADPRYDLRVDWLRNPDFPELQPQASPAQGVNRPLQASCYQINQQWQDFAVVLEGREIDGPYVPRSQLRDEAVPFDTDEELHARIVELAGMEHLVALLYLYALFSVISVQEAKTVADREYWPTLVDDVTYIRSVLMETAVGEMQHLRAVNLLLWNLAKSAGLPVTPAVVPPAKYLPLPGGGGGTPRPAALASLTLGTVQQFIDIERSSAYIDGQYARVTATLRQPGYPARLFELASTIAEEGEEHFLNFSHIHTLVSTTYPQEDPVYLRRVEEGDPGADPQVAKAIVLYREILTQLQTGYQRGDVSQQKALVNARKQMFDLQTLGENLAARHVGIPFLSVNF